MGVRIFFTIEEKIYFTRGYWSTMLQLLVYNGDSLMLRKFILDKL